MADELQFLIAPVAALCATALAQAVDFRLRGSMSGSYMAGALAGLAALAALLARQRAWESAETLALSVVALGIFAGGLVCFVCLVGLGVSLRLRIMGFLLRAGRPLAEAEIEARFEGGMLVRRRLDRLVQGGHVSDVDGRLASGGTWLTSVALFNATVKRFLTGRASEFHSK